MKLTYALSLAMILCGMSLFLMCMDGPPPPPPTGPGKELTTADRINKIIADTEIAQAINTAGIDSSALKTALEKGNDNTVITLFALLPSESEKKALQKFIESFKTNATEFAGYIDAMNKIKDASQKNRDARKKIIMDKFQATVNKPTEEVVGDINKPEYFNTTLFKNKTEADEFKTEVVDKILKVWEKFSAKPEKENLVTQYIGLKKEGKSTFMDKIGEVKKGIDEGKDYTELALLLQPFYLKAYILLTPESFNTTLFQDSFEADQFKKDVVDVILKAWKSYTAEEKDLLIKQYRLHNKQNKLKAFTDAVQAAKEALDKNSKMVDVKAPLKKLLVDVNKINQDFKKEGLEPKVIISKPIVDQKTEAEEDLESFIKSAQDLVSNLQQSKQLGAELAFKNMTRLSDKYSNKGDYNLDAIKDNKGRLDQDISKWQKFVEGLKKSTGPTTDPIKPKEFDMTPLAKALSDIK